MNNAKENRPNFIPPAMVLLVLTLASGGLMLLGLTGGLPESLGILNPPRPDGELDSNFQVGATLTQLSLMLVSLTAHGFLVVGCLNFFFRYSQVVAQLTVFTACIPCLSPGCLLGVPVGIWMFVLMRREGALDTFKH